MWFLVYSTVVAEVSTFIVGYASWTSIKTWLEPTKWTIGVIHSAELDMVQEERLSVLTHTRWFASQNVITFKWTKYQQTLISSLICSACLGVHQPFLVSSLSENVWGFDIFDCNMEKWHLKCVMWPVWAVGWCSQRHSHKLRHCMYGWWATYEL